MRFDQTDRLEDCNPLVLHTGWSLVALCQHIAGPNPGNIFPQVYRLVRCTDKSVNQGKKTQDNTSYKLKLFCLSKQTSMVALPFVGNVGVLQQH